MIRLVKIGMVAKTTNCDAGFLVEHFDDWIHRLFPIAAAIDQSNKEAANNR